MSGKGSAVSAPEIVVYFETLLGEPCRLHSNLALSRSEVLIPGEGVARVRRVLH